MSRLLPATFFALLLCFAVGGSATAQYACHNSQLAPSSVNTATNPCPASGDIVLPMPGGLEMVFRTVQVPGDDFWWHPERNIEIGNPDALMFEGARLVTVGGSFRNTDGDGWQMLLGKYEVSVAQFAAVMGEGDQAAGLRRLAALSEQYEDYRRLAEDDLSPLMRTRLLSRPVTGLPIRAYREFIERYTDWCYSAQACVSALPRFGSMPGFFRLPTEVEWEYAARGSGELYSGNLPFDADELGQHAYVSSSVRLREAPTSIGRFMPTNGLYDLFGNVSELSDDRFYAEIGQGKPGSSVSRGGNFSHRGDRGRIRVSLREEVPEYRRENSQTMMLQRSRTTGIRLAIGSQTIPDRATYGQIEREYDGTYRATARLNSAGGLSTRAGVLQAGDPINELNELIDSLASLPPGSSRAQQVLNEMRSRTESARVSLSQTSDELSYQLARSAMLAAAEAGRSQFMVRQRESALQSLANSTSPTAARTRQSLTEALAYYQDVRSNSEAVYVQYVRSLAGYREYAIDALERISENDLNRRDQAAFELVSEHTVQLLAGRGDTSDWLNDVARTFDDDTMFR